MCPSLASVFCSSPSLNRVPQKTEFISHLLYYKLRESFVSWKESIHSSFAKTLAVYRLVLEQNETNVLKERAQNDKRKAAGRFGQINSSLSCVSCRDWPRQLVAFHVRGNGFWKRRFWPSIIVIITRPVHLLSAAFFRWKSASLGVFSCPVCWRDLSCSDRD